ncbi:hypothetical protein PO909_005893 [Leuciscus waleckii]
MDTLFMLVQKERITNKTASTVASENVIEVQDEIATVVEEMPCPSRVSVAPKMLENVSEILEKEIVEKVSVAAADEEEVIRSQRIEQAECDSDDGSNSEDEASVNPEDGGSVLGDEECFFFTLNLLFIQISHIAYQEDESLIMFLLLKTF